MRETDRAACQRRLKMSHVCNSGRSPTYSPRHPRPRVLKIGDHSPGSWPGQPAASRGPNGGRDGRASLAHLLSRGSLRDGAARSGRVRRRSILNYGRKNGPTPERVSPKVCWQRRTLPPGPPGSTIRAAELNDRVRDGNGCTLCAKTTSDKHRGRKKGLEQVKG